MLTKALLSKALNQSTPKSVLFKLSPIFQPLAGLFTIKKENYLSLYKQLFESENGEIETPNGKAWIQDFRKTGRTEYHANVYAVIDSENEIIYEANIYYTNITKRPLVIIRDKVIKEQFGSTHDLHFEGKLSAMDIVEQWAIKYIEEKI